MIMIMMMMMMMMMDDEDGYGGCHLRERYCKGATGAKGVRPAVQAAVIMPL